MNITDNYGRSLDELAAIAVRLGRELEQAAHAVNLGGNSRDTGFVSRTLRRLGEREPFDPRDQTSLEALVGMLEADLKSEALGTERRFVETHYDAEGQHGEAHDCAIYSERGERLIAVRDHIIQFMAARDAILDRIAAERALTRLLAS